MDRHSSTHSVYGLRVLQRFSALLFLLLASGYISAQDIPACIDVFPDATTPVQQPPDVLTLPPFPDPNDGDLSIDNNDSLTLNAGEFFFTSISLGTGAELEVNGSARIFVEGGVTISNRAEINLDGDPENLIILANGSVSIGTRVEMNTVLYSEGAVSIGNRAEIDGAITARGPIGIGARPVIDYDEEAIRQGDFGGLCDNEQQGPAELILEYRMEQADWTGTAGEVLDTSGFERHATAVNGPDTEDDDPAIPGNPGTCRYGELDGNNDGVDEPRAGAYLNGLDAITVMAWVYNTGPLDDNDRGVFFTNNPGPGQDNRLGLRYDTDGFFGNENNVIKASVFTDDCNLNDECLQVESEPDVMVRNQWQHVAMTWVSGGEIKVFVDGSRVGISAVEGAGGNGTIAAVNALNIGQGAKGERWQGRIDEFRIFDGALAESEIQTWKDTTAPCDTLLPDHIRLLHPGTGLTCQPSQIAVQACIDPACSALFDEEVTVSLTSPAGNWAPNPVTFTGQTMVDLQITTPGFVTLDAAADPPANNPTRCFTGGAETCQMEWLDTGFVIDAPDHVSATTQAATIAAVRTDDQTRSCAAAFGNETRTVEFWSGYLNPDTGTLPVSLDGTPIAGAAPGTGIDLNFDANGVATVDLRYDDVGSVLVNARFQGSGDEAGLILTGQDAFTARPATFTLEIPGNPAASDSAGPVFTTAGADFEVETRARNAAGTLTPNFGRESTPEGVVLDTGLIAPVGGNAPALNGNFGAFGEDCDGSPVAGGAACGAFAWPEVGIIEATPRLASGAYLGTADVVGDASGPIGRFIPSHFNLAAGALTDRVALDACDDEFTYVGELFGADWTLDARNAAGVTTTNYEGAFARLGADALSIAADEDITVDSSSIVWAGGFGTAAAEIRADRGAPTGPYEDFQVGAAPVDRDGVELAAFDVDLSGDGMNDHGLIGTTELRFGRLVVDNAVGSELGPLTLPLRAEFFEDATWKPNTLDDCTAMALADHIALTSSNGDAGDGTISVSVGSGSTSIQESGPVSLAGGRAGFTFSAPGSPGWVELSLLLDMDWHFLRDDLDDDGNFLENPSARASFGLFDGDENRILLQEIPPR